MGIKRIVITGGPGTGKTSIINELNSRKFKCLEEISREVTLEAQKKGIDQLFLSHPLLFSELLLEGRVNQYKLAESIDSDLIFFDRGIPDVLAYMDYVGENYPEQFIKASKEHKYDQVFILAPWQEIYQSDNERYESFDQALEIHKFLINTYGKFGYDLIDVPFGSIVSRTDFIIDLSNISENE